MRECLPSDERQLKREPVIRVRAIRPGVVRELSPVWQLTFRAGRVRGVFGHLLEQPLFVDFPAARSERVQEGRSDSTVGAVRSSRAVVVPTTLVMLVRLPYLAN
jgi:hypothetical protein